jgi:hypothetical protein
MTSIASWEILGKLEVRVIGVVDDEKPGTTEIR